MQQRRKYQLVLYRRIISYTIRLDTHTLYSIVSSMPLFSMRNTEILPVSGTNNRCDAMVVQWEVGPGRGKCRSRGWGVPNAVTLKSSEGISAHENHHPQEVKYS